MIRDSTQLGDFLKKESSRLGLHLAHDTHYDAMNWQLSWWRKSVLHRLDFQPLEKDTVAITHYRDSFRYLPRLCRWLHNNVPMFPYLAHINWNRLSTDSFPLKEENVSSYIDRALTA